VKRWFVDTAYAVALANVRDSLHSRALALDRQIESEGVQLVTTEGVLLEIATALRSVRLRQIAVGAVERFWHNSIVVELTADLLHESWEMYKRHSDKEWSWVDTISFVVMRREGMTEALTSDHHFEQASFRALLAPEQDQ
jgi:predicted nucleic acid-binding protein